MKTKFAFVFALFFFVSQNTYAQFGKLLRDVKNKTQKVKNAKKDVKSITGKIPKKTSSNKNSTVKAAKGGNNFYVSATTGGGRVGSKEAPVKDIAILINQVKAGDVIHVAEGTYTSKGDRGTDIFEVPVSIIGGYSPDFSSRDPWGQYKSIFSGKNDYHKSETTPRIKITSIRKHREWKGTILLDGLMIDNGERNQYKTEKEELILRKATPSTGRAATPSLPGIEIDAGKYTNVTIRNCVLVNVGSSVGALSVKANQNAQVLIENNAIINCTGNGINAMSSWHSDSGQPTFNILNNTILFTWRESAAASSYSGASLRVDPRLVGIVEKNVFGFADFGGVDNGTKCLNLTVKNNLFTGHKKYDYKDFNTAMKLDEIEDGYADYLTNESVGNFSATIQVPVSKSWAELYANRGDVSREQIDAAVTVSNSGANQLRSMLGLAVIGNAVKLDASVWMHRMSLEDAIEAGSTYYEGIGASKPK